jgi:hypothetical protein
MRRARRIIGRSGVALALLAALAVAALWVRSYWKTEAWYRGNYAAATREMRGYTVASQRGQAGFSYMYICFSPSAELKVKSDGNGGSVYLVPYFSHQLQQPLDPSKARPARPTSPNLVGTRRGLCADLPRAPSPIRAHRHQ